MPRDISRAACPGGRLRAALVDAAAVVADEARERALARRQKEIALELVAAARRRSPRRDRMIGHVARRAAAWRRHRRRERGARSARAAAHRVAHRVEAALAARAARSAAAPRRRRSRIPRRPRGRPRSRLAKIVPAGRPISRRTAQARRRIASTASPGRVWRIVRSFDDHRVTPAEAIRESGSAQDGPGPARAAPASPGGSAPAPADSAGGRGSRAAGCGLGISPAAPAPPARSGSAPAPPRAGPPCRDAAAARRARSRGRARRCGRDT